MAARLQKRTNGKPMRRICALLAAREYPLARVQGAMVIARRNVLMGFLVCTAFGAGGVLAAEPSAKSFVEAIYAAYKGKNTNGISLDNGTAVRRYFAPKLAALIIKDPQGARGEVGELDAGPLIDVEDWEVRGVGLD